MSVGHDQVDAPLVPMDLTPEPAGFVDAHEHPDDIDLDVTSLVAADTSGDPIDDDE